MLLIEMENINKDENNSNLYVKNLLDIFHG